MADDDLNAFLMKNYEKNKAYAKPDDSGYMTTLSPAEEIAFKRWAMANDVKFDHQSPINDYDMRGFYKALMNKDPIAVTAINANDGRRHFPDYWKTPYHKSFSAESKWAGKGAPSWNKLDQLVLPNGNVVYDERAKQMPAATATPPVAAAAVPNVSAGVPYANAEPFKPNLVGGI